MRSNAVYVTTDKATCAAVAGVESAKGTLHAAIAIHKSKPRTDEEKAAFVLRVAAHAEWLRKWAERQVDHMPCGMDGLVDFRETIAASFDVTIRGDDPAGG